MCVYVCEREREIVRVYANEIANHKKTKKKKKKEKNGEDLLL